MVNKNYLFPFMFFSTRQALCRIVPCGFFTVVCYSVTDRKLLLTRDLDLDINAVPCPLG